MTSKRHTAKSRRSRGQAMVEYSIINWLLIVGLVCAASVRIIPGAHERKNVIEMFLDAYQTYYDSFFLVLNSPFP